MMRVLLGDGDSTHRRHRHGPAVAARPSYGDGPGLTRRPKLGEDRTASTVRHGDVVGQPERASGVRTGTFPRGPDAIAGQECVSTWYHLNADVLSRSDGEQLRAIERTLHIPRCPCQGKDR